jgi:tetratricopeptide (TPR) repeat protein/predicted Ser/Thr protein kinase
VSNAGVETLFEGWVERHIVHGEELDPAVLCADRPEELLALQALIFRYRKLSDSLDGAPMTVSRATAVTAGRAALLPAFEGFRTIERIGAGGMGEVYKLQDLKLGRFVAAKVLRADRGLTPNLADFLSEAQALAVFQDPRIVQIHELREQAVPPVLIMEYVDGFELGRLAPSLAYDQRARIVKEVCEAIHQAHQLGVQHRDLKPSNIMLDAQLRPKILDFGLSSSDPARGHFRGTPQYLAPEQLDPSQPIDARTDVYALGAVLYELLTGVPPVDGPTVDAIVANVRAGAVRLPVEISVGTPEPLQAIALKALETKPANRYASAQEMALDLGLYLSGHPVTARPSPFATTLTGVLPKPRFPGKRLWVSVALLVVALLWAFIWRTAMAPGATKSGDPARIAVLPFENHGVPEDTKVAENVVRTLGVNLALRERAALKAVGTDDTEAYDFYLRGLEFADRGLNKPNLEGGIRMFQAAVDRDPRFVRALARLARTHAAMYFYAHDRSQERADRARDALDRLAALGPDLAETHMTHGYYQHFVVGDDPRALDEFKTALSLQPKNAEVLEGISYVFRHQGRWQEFAEETAKWLEIEPRSPVALLQHGQACALLGRYSEADRAFALYLSSKSGSSFAWAWRASIQLLWHGDVEKARALVDEARQEPFMRDLPQWLAQTTFRIALIKRDFQGALRQLEAQKSEAFENAFIYRPIENLRGEVHRLSGANDSARISFEASRRRLLELIAKQPDESRFYSALGIAYAGLGLREEALRAATRGTEMMPPSKDLWRALWRIEDLAAVHTMLGQQDEAIERLDFLLSRTGEISTHMLRLEPRWDPLRANPRFQALLAKHGNPS